MPESLKWALIGAGGWALIGVIGAVSIDRETRDGLARVVTAAVLMPAIVLAGIGLYLPALRRRRVTADSMLNALNDNAYEQRVWAITWRSRALVLLRRKKKCRAPAPPMPDLTVSDRERS